MQEPQIEPSKGYTRHGVKIGRPARCADATGRRCGDCRNCKRWVKDNPGKVLPGWEKPGELPAVHKYPSRSAVTPEMAARSAAKEEVKNRDWSECIHATDPSAETWVAPMESMPEGFWDSSAVWSLPLRRRSKKERRGSLEKKRSKIPLRRPSCWPRAGTPS